LRFSKEGYSYNSLIDSAQSYGNSPRSLAEEEKVSTFNDLIETKENEIIQQSLKVLIYL
jgi:hypothetical protein